MDLALSDKLKYFKVLIPKVRSSKLYPLLVSEYPLNVLRKASLRQQHLEMRKHNVCGC